MYGTCVPLRSRTCTCRPNVCTCRNDWEKKPGTVTDAVRLRVSFPRGVGASSLAARQEARKALTTVPEGNAGCSSPDAQKSASGLS
jgi:hypothetical protein